MAWLALGTTTRELHDGDTVVGSGPEADWRVTTADLSPRHFIVRVQGNRATVEPNSPDQIVALGGRQVSGATPLGAGEAILAGGGRFSFTDERPETATIGDVPPESAYLVDDAGRVAHPLGGRSTPIGRDAANAVVVRAPTASRFHAEVRREAGGFSLHSMGATGTLVNGRTAEHPVLLSEGDVVEIAFERLRFSRQAPSGGISLAAPHSTRSDDSGRRPTLEPGERIVVGEDSAAGRHTRRVQILVALGVVLAAALWWGLARRG